MKSRTGRHARQTRLLLQQALKELIAERGYAGLSVRDIATRAQVGRTTFYLYYKNKDDLFTGAHFDQLADLGWSLTVDDLLAAEPPAYLVRFIETVGQERAEYLNVGRSEDWLIVLRRIREHIAQEIERCLRSGFDERSARMPFDILANYLAGAQQSLVWWWLENRCPYSAQQIAETYQTLQRAAIRDALRLPARA